MSETGPWSPDPDNWAPWAEANLTDSLGQAAEVAAEVGVRIHLEGHQLVTLRDAAVTRLGRRCGRLALGARGHGPGELDHS